MGDGIKQTKYKVVKKVVTELYTKISVDLLFKGNASLLDYEDEEEYEDYDEHTTEKIQDILLG